MERSVTVILGDNTNKKICSDIINKSRRCLVFNYIFTGKYTN
jgi:hypothetical protein